MLLAIVSNNVFDFYTKLSFAGGVIIAAERWPINFPSRNDPLIGPHTSNSLKKKKKRRPLIPSYPCKSGADELGYLILLVAECNCCHFLSLVRHLPTIRLPRLVVG